MYAMINLQELEMPAYQTATSYDRLRVRTGSIPFLDVLLISLPSVTVSQGAFFSVSLKVVYNLLTRPTMVRVLKSQHYPRFSTSLGLFKPIASFS